MISFKQALHFKQLLILITAAGTYLGLRGAFPFTVIGHLIKKGRKQSRTQRQSIKGVNVAFTVHKSNQRLRRGPTTWNWWFWR